MSNDEFWAIIERSLADEPEEQLERLRAALAPLDPEDLLLFDAYLLRRVNDAYRRDLWGAAYLINGGASDDGFEYFRRWLVGRGRFVYKAALANPDSLARLAVAPDRAELESLSSVGREEYERKTRKRYPTRHPAWPVEWPGEPTGDRWDFDGDAEMRTRLPELAARYLGPSDTQSHE